MTTEKKITQAAVRKKILEFLNATSAQPDSRTGKYHCGMKHRNALVLATSYKDVPRATALEFFNEGLNLYILGGPGGKIANIKRNSKVSAFIYEQPLNHSVYQKSLQIFGKAELITVRNNPRLFKAKMHKWNLYTVMERLLGPIVKEKKFSGTVAEDFIRKGIEASSIIKIIPDHIIMKEYPPNFTVKRFEWRK